MEQIYYTQCPIGYGLGASNGFQIKRLTENYPISGDFRHFNLRAYPGGTRTLAPRTLRYRRDGDTAEVAYLTPRTQEYETERGLWGRPGGHFAHGLRLSPEELAPLANWAGGLFSSRFWKTTDPEPSRGRPPDDLLVTPHALAAPPTLANARPFLADLPADFLAQLLAAVALATHQQQTLFLIDAPERLADRVAGLTLAFPPTLRRTLTFSTFHDRPEELTGYRIQGTSPIARPNRAILSHQGFLAEISERSITPAMPTLPWATSLAEAILAARPEDDAWAQDVEAVAQRAIGHRDPGEPEAWSNQWLDQLLAFPSSVKEPAIPRSEEDWESTLRALAWAKAGRLTRPWSARRGVAWFRNAIDETAPTPLIKECLARHLECRELWETAGSPSGWGGIAGDVLATYAGENPVGDVDRLMKRVPDTARPGFVQAMLHRMPPDSSERILSHLRRDARLDRALLLPLEAVHSLQALWSHQDPGPLRDVVAEASARPGLLSAVLDALDREVGSQEIALEVAAAAVAEALSLATAQEWLPWMLRKEGRTVAWFRPWIRPTMAEGGGTMTWEQVRDLTPADLRADLARTFLEVAADPKLPELAFQWGVENLVVSLNPEDQPVSSGWPLLYLQKLESDLDLIDRLMVKKTRVRGLGKWLKSAHERGHLDDAARRRMADVRRFLDVVEFGTVEDLSGLTLPQVPPRDRGRLLSRLANSFLGSQFEGLGPILDACLRAWPDGVYPGADGLEGIGTVIAGWLEPWAVHPSAWTDQLEGILARMGIPAESGLSWEPDGLAAFVLSATNARGGSRSTWPLREFLLSDPARRRVLALEVLRELAGVKPLEAPGVYERWDSRLAAQPGRAILRGLPERLRRPEDGGGGGIEPAGLPDVAPDVLVEIEVLSGRPG